MDEKEKEDTKKEREEEPKWAKVLLEKWPRELILKV